MITFTAILAGFTLFEVLAFRHGAETVSYTHLTLPTTPYV